MYKKLVELTADEWKTKTIVQLSDSGNELYEVEIIKVEPDGYLFGRNPAYLLHFERKADGAKGKIDSGLVIERVMANRLKVV